MCIPRVYPNISEGRIRKIFDELNIGVIDRVDIVSKNTEKGEKFNRVFIHMDRWFHNSNASVARERLLGGKDIKIIYDDYRNITKKYNFPIVFDFPAGHIHENNTLIFGKKVSLEVNDKETTLKY